MRRAGPLAQDGFGQQRRDEVARDEVAGAVDEEAPVGVAVPGDADVGLLGDDALDDVGAVFFDERVGLVVGEGPVHLHAHRDHLAGQPLEQLRRHQAAHAVAGVEHALERLDRGLVDEREHVLDVGGHDVPARPASRRRRRRRQRAVLDHVADVAQPGVAAERQRLGAHHLDAVVLRRVVRRGDLRAAFQSRAGDGEVHHVGRHHPVVDDVGALRSRALDERFGQRGRRQPHVARHGDLLAPR